MSRNPTADDDRNAPPNAGLAILQLLRLPNVFTAWADVLLGYWITQPEGVFGDTMVLALLVTASTSLYWAGMVWNDVFDVAIDRIERPRRPLPSGAIGLPIARGLAIGLTLAGLTAAAFAGRNTLIVATLLTTAILVYNGGLKATLLGPLVMGACRSLNVLLGESLSLDVLLRPSVDPEMPALGPGTLAAVSLFAWWLIPAANGIYVAGVTFFARHEATESSRAGLSAAMAVMAAGLGLHAYTLSRSPEESAAAWQVGAVLVLVLGYRLGRAVVRPTPIRVQQAIITSLLSLIAIDATMLLALQDRAHALWVIMLVAPSLFVGRWLYGT